MKAYRPGGNNGSYGVEFHNYTNAKSSGSLLIKDTAKKNLLTLEDHKLVINPSGTKKIQFGDNNTDGGISLTTTAMIIGDVEAEDAVQSIKLQVWGGNKYLTIQEDGIGIDKASPSHPLDVTGTVRATTLIATGNLSKGSGTFTIPHPNPSKSDTHKLQHSFVESPTRGDNLYRWTKKLVKGSNTVDLPDYYKYLNENDMVWVNPVGHFGRAYGEVNESQTQINIEVEIDGEYNILCIGTRKDKVAVTNFEGVEIKNNDKE